MKQKLKKSLKIGILIFGISTLILNCQKENQLDQTEPEPHNQKKQLDITMIPWEHLEGTNSRIAEKISSFRKSGLAQREIESSAYGFYIEDSRIQVIQRDNFTTYTFFVIRDSVLPNIIENYTYKEYDDGTYEQYLLKYHYTLDEQDEIIYDTNILEIEAINDSSLLANRGSSCVPEFVQVLDGFTCTYNTRCTGNGNHEAGDSQCTCTPSPSTCDPAGSTSCEYSYIYEYQGCSGGTQGDPNENPDPNNNNNNGGNGTTTGNNPPDLTPGVPMEDPRPIWYNVTNCINGLTIIGQTDATSIDTNILNSLGLTPVQWRDYGDFLNNNGCSEQAQEQVIEELMEIFDEQIFIDEEFENNTCLKSVYDGMGKASTFNNYLKNFEAEFSVAHLRFSTSTTLSNNTNAETSVPDNYLIKITFNENNLNRPNLAIAKTFIHEIIHAEMFRKLLSISQTPNLQSLTPSVVLQLKDDYPGLYDYYVRWKNNIPNGMNASSAQHQAMAQHYRGIIEQALREYDSTQSDETYEAIAWIGLKNTMAWNNLTQTQRDNIDQTISTFYNSNPNCQ